MLCVWVGFVTAPEAMAASKRTAVHVWPQSSRDKEAADQIETLLWNSLKKRELGVSARFLPETKPGILDGLQEMLDGAKDLLIQDPKGRRNPEFRQKAEGAFFKIKGDLANVSIGDLCLVHQLVAIGAFRDQQEDVTRRYLSACLNVIPEAYGNASTMAMDMERFATQFEVDWQISPKAQAHVESNPPGAVVEIDGKKVGVTPYTEKLKPGLHFVRLFHEGYFPAGSVIEVTEGEENRVRIPLKGHPSRSRYEKGWQQIHKGVIKSRTEGLTQAARDILRLSKGSGLVALVVKGTRTGYSIKGVYSDGGKSITNLNAEIVRDHTILQEFEKLLDKAFATPTEP